MANLILTKYTSKLNVHAILKSGDKGPRPKIDPLQKQTAHAFKSKQAERLLPTYKYQTGTLMYCTKSYAFHPSIFTITLSLILIIISTRSMNSVALLTLLSTGPRYNK